MLGLWRIKIQSKTTAKNNEIIAGKYEALEKTVNNVVGTLEVLFTKLMQDYCKMTKEQFNDLMEQYQKTKLAFLEAVVNADEETEVLIQKAKEISKDITEQEKSLESAKNIENNAISEPETPQVEEVAQEETNEQESASLEDEYILVEKSYGE